MLHTNQNKALLQRISRQLLSRCRPPSKIGLDTRARRRHPASQGLKSQNLRACVRMESWLLPSFNDTKGKRPGVTDSDQQNGDRYSRHFIGPPTAHPARQGFEVQFATSDFGFKMQDAKRKPARAQPQESSDFRFQISY